MNLKQAKLTEQYMNTGNNMPTLTAIPLIENKTIKRMNVQEFWVQELKYQ